jgi:hypothetical protein
MIVLKLYYCFIVLLSKQKALKEILQKNKIQILFALAGALGGFMYWKFVGCNSGTCPIKSVWYWSTLWGGAVGYLIGDLLNGLLIKRKKKSSDDSEV